ncbi:MAG: hypothetical protein ACFFAV_02260 [Candidatus Hermodarchaeota archaeon]
MGKIANKIQGLVIFKKAHPLEKTDSYTVEEINKEDKVTFSNNLRPQANRYIYTIVLNNNGSFPISKVKINVISPKFLNYFGYFPLTINLLPVIKENKDNDKNIEIIFGELKEHSSQEISLQFTPYISPSIGEFKSIITYVNNRGEMKILSSEPIKIKIEKLTLIPKIIPSSQIREFTRLPGTFRDLMSYGIGIRKKINFIDIIEHILLSQNLQLITKDNERGMLWFCGTDMQSNSDILAFSKIVSNRIEIILYSKNPIILASFLFLFTNILREQLSIKKILKKILKSEAKMFELVCVNCGAILSYFPRKGEFIACNKCNHEQIVW